MTHPSQLQLSMHADNALPADEAATLDAHLQTCTTCRTRLSALREESRWLGSVLQFQERTEVVVPRFSRPATLRGFALANVATGLVIWLVQFLWKTLFGELVVNATTWVTSIYLPDVYAMASRTALYFLQEGTAMFDAYLGFIVFGMLTLTALGLLLKHRQARASAGMCLLAMALASTAVPTPVHALDIRRDEGVVSIPASETIDDTLLIAGDTVLIEGDVTGDVVAAGRTIDISGSVGGNLVTFGESIKVRGEVGGLALGAGSSYTLDGAQVGGDLWAAGNSVSIDVASRVENATVAGQSTSIAGTVAKDLFAFAETVELSGDLGRNLEAFADRVRLLSDAHVGGDVKVRSRDEDALYRADTARVDGNVEFLALPEALQEENPYTTFEFYLWQIARLIAALLAGLALLWLVPGLRSISIGAGVDGLKSAGIGFLTVVAVPIVALLLGITLVGLPFSIVGVAALLLCLYLAKILIGAIVGRMLLGESAGLALSLLTGLIIVIVAVNVPFIGGIINFILTIVGLGLLVQFVYAAVSSRDEVTLA